MWLIASNPLTFFGQRLQLFVSLSVVEAPIGTSQLSSSTLSSTKYSSFLHGLKYTCRLAGRALNIHCSFVLELIPGRAGAAGLIFECKIKKPPTSICLSFLSSLAAQAKNDATMCDTKRAGSLTCRATVLTATECFIITPRKRGQRIATNRINGKLEPKHVQERMDG